MPILNILEIIFIYKLLFININLLENDLLKPYSVMISIMCRSICLSEERKKPITTDPICVFPKEKHPK